MYPLNRVSCPDNYFEELAKLSMHAIRMLRNDDKFFDLVIDEVDRAQKRKEFIRRIIGTTPGSLS